MVGPARILRDWRRAVMMAVSPAWTEVLGGGVVFVEWKGRGCAAEGNGGREGERRGRRYGAAGACGGLPRIGDGGGALRPVVPKVLVVDGGKGYGLTVIGER